MMGRYAAHRVVDLPAPIAQRIERARAVMDGKTEIAADEVAAAIALVERPVESPQCALDLSPHPCDAKDTRRLAIKRDDTG